MLCLFSICAVAFSGVHCTKNSSLSRDVALLRHTSGAPLASPRTLQFAFVRSLHDSDGLFRNNHLLGIALSLDPTVQLRNLQ